MDPIDRTKYHRDSLAFRALLTTLWEMHEQKMQGYGTKTDPLANLRASAELGVEPFHATLIRANDKWQRIKSWCEKHEAAELPDEKLEDNLLDLASYCLLALVLKQE